MNTLFLPKKKRKKRKKKEINLEKEKYIKCKLTRKIMGKRD